MRRESFRWRAVTAVIVLSIVGSLVAGSGASGDPIVEKRAEARSVADELEQITEQAEILAEKYNDARLEVARVQRKVRVAQATVRRTRSQLSERRRELALYAVNAYVRGGEDVTTMSVFLGAEDGNSVGRRQGYAKAALGDRADLIARLRAAKVNVENDLAELATTQTRAETAEAQVEVKRNAAQAAVTKQRRLLTRVRGELAGLVKAERARRAAAAAQKAREAMRRLAAEQAAATRRASDAQPAPTIQPSRGSGTATPGPAPAPAPVVAPVGQGAGAAIAAGRSVLGVRYTWGGASPATGFDCSGFVLWAWQHGGRSLPHSSRAMYSSSRRIPMSEIQPGDLIFYGRPTVHHVALYIGGGQIIHSPSSGSSVRYDSVYYWDALVGAGRI